MKKAKIIKISINIIIILSWLAMMLLLIKKEGILNGRGVESSFRELIPEDIEIDSWKGLYISGQWAGFMYTNMGQFHEQSKRGYIINSLSSLRFRMFNELKNIELSSTQVLDNTFRLMRFNAKISGMTDIAITGKRMGEYVMIEIEYNKEKFRKTFEAENDLFLENSILSIYRGKDLKIGDSYKLDIFNPLSLSAEPAIIKVIGEEGNLLVLETKFGGITSKSWVDKKGYVVREETTNGWLLKLETKEKIEEYIAEYADKGVDILTSVAVITDRQIESPRDTGLMKIKVSGVDISDFSFDGKRQGLIDKKEGIVEIKAVSPDERMAITIPYRGEELSKYLEPSIWIQCRDARIKTKASEIIGDETNSWLAAKKIGEWVYENIERSFTVGIPLATSVLLYRKGDCNEYSVLFIALARASGIPAEMCAGLVYLEDGFYYHAWPKVYIGEWIHLDPAFGQPVADATHIELVSGDFAEQSKIALTLGNLKINILEVQKWRDILD